MQDFNFNESKQRGTKEFPIEYYYVDSTHPQYIMPFHWHMDYEFVRVVSGCFSITLDGEEYELSANDFCFIPAGMLHGGTPDNCVYECIVFDIEFLRCRGFAPDHYLKKFSHEQLMTPVIYIQKRTTSIDCSLPAASLFSVLKQKCPGYELLTMGYLYQLFGRMEQCGCYQEDKDRKKKLHQRTNQLKASIEYMEQSYSSSITLDEIASTAGMSPKYFCRIFKQLTHHTPIDYLNEYRIERACSLITASDLSLTEICYQCGFNDFSYFIKTFKRYKQMTPKKYAASEIIH